MDANALSHLWHSKNRIQGHQTEAREREFETFIVACDLEVLNEPSREFTFDGPTGRSDIDVTLGRGVDGVYQVGWDVLPELVHSDHNAIRVTLSRSDGGADLPLPVHRWRTADVDWGAYGAALAEAAGGLDVDALAGSGPAAVAEAVTSLIRGVNESRLGAAGPPPRRRSRWWTRELTSARRLARRARGALQRARRREAPLEERAGLRAAYREAYRGYHRLLLRRKEEDWRSFVGAVGNADPWGDVYRILRDRRGPVDIGGVRVGGTHAVSWEASARALLGRFFPRHPERGAAGATAHPAPDPPPAPVSLAELRSAMKRMKIRSAPGPDGITVPMVRALVTFAPGLALAMYNGCLEAGVFPPQWKIARVVAILKGPGRPPDEAGSYRPISLLSALGKLLEKVLVRRLEGRAEHSLDDRQFGFRAGRGTEDAWHSAIRVVEESPHKYVLGTFVDFKGAFDHLSWDTILGILGSAGCPELGIWRSFFSGRRAFMASRYDRVELGVERGCPQGSMSGPILWNLALDPLLRRLRGANIEVVAYADDTLLISSGDSRLSLEARAAEGLEMIREWGAGSGVAISLEKTACMVLRGRFAPTRRPRVLLDGSALPYREEVRYLGILVGERLNFEPHLRGIREKTASLVCQLRRVMRRDWGLRRRTIGSWYRGLFVPCALYGASVWGGYVRARATAGVQLNRAQRPVLLASLHVCRTVSTEAMTVLMGELPWDLEAKCLEADYYLRKGLPVPWGLPPAEGEGAAVDKALVRRAAWREWRTRWRDCGKGATTRLFAPDPAVPAELLRGACFGLCTGYLLTGHGSLREYLHRRTLSETPECRCGGAEETSPHVLLECPLYAEQRDLGTMGIHRDAAGAWVLHGVVNSPGSFQALRRFAGWAFDERARLDADG